MKYPYVESSQSFWRFETLYHDIGSVYFNESKPTDQRADVDHHRLAYSGVLREITELGGDPDDIADASLYWVAQEVTWSMRVSTTPVVLEHIGEVWGMETGEELGRRLKGRAEQILAGAALVGALRAIAWQLTRDRPRVYRNEVIKTAREEYDRCELVSGKADLIADDAHAHLYVAERIRSGNEDIQRELRHRGTVLLGAAHAQMMCERWNPFTLYRLRNEMAEHTESIAEATKLNHELREAFAQVVSETNSFYASSIEQFHKEISSLRGDDIAAYFGIRERCPGSLPLDALSAPARVILELEPTLTRIL